MIVDHGDATILHRILEALAILFVADAMFGMPSMSSFLVFQSLHQDPVGRTAHRFTFTPVQMVDPSACHSAKPAGGLDQDHLGTFFFRCQRRHDATGRATIHADIRFVPFDFGNQAAWPNKQSVQNYG